MEGDGTGDHAIAPLSVEQKWLREARRNAVDAAQELIAHLAHAHKELPVVKVCVIIFANLNRSN